MTETTALLCNGELERSLKNRIKACDKVFAVDGGLKYCRELGLEPDGIIGDFDSVGEILAEYPPQKLIPLPRLKDKTDLEVALEKVKGDKIVVYGGLKGRLDHILTHLYLLLRKPETLCFESDKELVFAINERSSPFQIEKGAFQTLVLFPLNGVVEEVRIETEEEVKAYERLENHELLSLPLEGICNVTVKNGELIVILLSEARWTPLVAKLQQLAQKNYVSLPHETVIHVHAEETVILPSQKGLTVSLIPWFGPAKNIKTEGLKWNLGIERTVLDKNFIGISNVCLGDSFLVEVGQGELLCIINHDLIDLDMVYA